MAALRPTLSSSHCTDEDTEAKQGLESKSIPGHSPRPLSLPPHLCARPSWTRVGCLVWGLWGKHRELPAVPEADLLNVAYQFQEGFW